jgi:hypothetical protein
MCLSVLLLVAAIAGSDRRPLERRWRIFIPAASVADFRSMFLIRLDGCSRQWLLQRFQGLESICRTGGRSFLASMFVGVGGGWERGRRLKKKADLVVIFLSFKVLDVKWGCTVHHY